MFEEFIFAAYLLRRFRAFTVRGKKIEKIFTSNLSDDFVAYVLDQNVQTVITTSNPNLASLIEAFYTTDLFGQFSAYIVSSPLLGRLFDKKLSKNPEKRLEAIKEIIVEIPDLRVPPSLGGIRPIRYEDFLYALAKGTERPETFSDRFAPSAMHAAWIPLQFFDFSDSIGLIYILANIGDPRWYNIFNKSVNEVLLKMWRITEKGFEKTISFPERVPSGSLYFPLISCWYHSDLMPEGLRNLEREEFENQPKPGVVGHDIRDVFIRKAHRFLKEAGFSGVVEPIFDYLPRLFYEMSRYILYICCSLTEWALSGYPEELLCPEMFLDYPVEVQAFREYLSLLKPKVMSEQEFLNEALFPDREISGNKGTDPANN